MQPLNNQHFSEKLHSIRMIDSGITYQAVATQFDASIDSIRKILDTRNHSTAGSHIKRLCSTLVDRTQWNSHVYFEVARME